MPLTIDQEAQDRELGKPIAMSLPTDVVTIFEDQVDDEKGVWSIL
jgi:hypothetical protein